MRFRNFSVDTSTPSFILDYNRDLAMASKEFADLNVAIMDEDPHLRQRIVSMKVLVLGYPRTGTSCAVHPAHPDMLSV